MIYTDAKTSELNPIKRMCQCLWSKTVFKSQLPRKMQLDLLEKNVRMRNRFAGSDAGVLCHGYCLCRRCSSGDKTSQASFCGSETQRLPTEAHTKTGWRGELSSEPVNRLSIIHYCTITHNRYQNQSARDPANYFNYNLFIFVSVYSMCLRGLNESAERQVTVNANVTMAQRENITIIVHEKQ